MILPHVAGSPSNLESVVKAEEGMDEVLLSPTPTLFDHPALRVVEGEEDVVDVDKYARFEPRQHFEEQEVDIPARYNRVA